MMVRDWPNAVAHVDADCFYASCELIRRPDLRGKPLCVLSSQDACVVAKTYDAKAAGIATGMPVWEAKKKLPQAVYLSADFAYYGQISHKMFSILRRFSPEVEVCSIDEGFMDMNGLRILWYQGFTGIADELRQTVKREVGVSISAGVSVTKTLAKMASESHKPDGTTVVPGRQIEAFLSELDVRAIPGIGANRAALLRKFHITSALAFSRLPQGLVHRLLGKAGIDLWHELHGTPVFPLELAPRLPKSVARTASMGAISGDQRLLGAHLTHHTARLATELTAKKLLARRLTVFLRLKSFQCVAYKCRLDYPSSNFFRLNALVRQGLRRLYQSGTMYRGCGVVAYEISQAEDCAEDLFGIMREDARQAKLMLTLAEINHKYGKNAVYTSTRTNNAPGSHHRFRYPYLQADKSNR